MKTPAHYPKAKMLELQWKDIRTDFMKLHSTLAKIIDEINPSAEFTFFKATYPFGAEILKDGVFFIPNQNGDLTSIKNPDIPADIREKLSYNLYSNPVAMLLKNTAEFFTTFENYTTPLFYGLIQPGRLSGIWRVLNQGHSHTPTFLWNMTAGARSLFLLPKITDTLSYNRLRQTFQLDIEKPKKFLDHWNVFREIANHPAFGEPWETEILFFSRIWFQHLNDPVWQKFKLYFLETAWNSSEYFRNDFIWDTIFSMIQYQRKIKPDPYIADTARHLLAISVSAQPGLAPAITDEAGPIKKLQEVFNEIYRLDYAPVIMQPAFLSAKDSKPVYYSLEYPTTTRFSPKSREKTSKITELYETMRLLEKYRHDIAEDKYNVTGSPLFEAVQNVEYAFFHPDSAKYNKSILSHTEVQKGDITFAKIENFPFNSAFLAGCIRIKFKEN